LLSISSLFAYAEGMDVWLYGEGSPVGKEKQNIFIFMGYARMAKAWQNSHTNCLFPTHPVLVPPIPIRICICIWEELNSTPNSICPAMKASQVQQQQHQ